MKSKFGILDIFIILMVICLLFVGIKVLSGQNPAPTVQENEEIAFTIEIKTADENLKNSIKKNDIIYNSKNDITYGTITDITVVQATEITANVNSAEYITTTYDDKYDIYLSIKGNPESITDKHITIAEEKLKIGSLTHIESNNYVASGYVVEIERGDN